MAIWQYGKMKYLLKVKYFMAVWQVGKMKYLIDTNNIHYPYIHCQILLATTAAIIANNPSSLKYQRIKKFIVAFHSHVYHQFVYYYKTIYFLVHNHQILRITSICCWYKTNNIYYVYANSDWNKYHESINDHQLQSVFHVIFCFLGTNHRSLWWILIKKLIIIN